MFLKLAYKNIKRSIKDYAIYFFTLVLGVAIFYIFNSLESQAVMLNVNERMAQILDLISVIMRVVSVLVACILGALIIYASRFLIKRRSKEFGIYLTLGMSKRKISAILLIETFLIGITSLGVGLLLGIAASQLTSVLVANMFQADMTNYQFVFSGSALLQTAICFGIIYLIVMIFNTIVISRQKLINLLSSSKRNEKVKLKNLWLCTIIFIIAAVMLGFAYYWVTDGLQNFMMDADGPNRLLIPIVMGVMATFLLFWSLSGLLLRIFISLKPIYYARLNSFVLRQFSSQINTTVVSMSLICLMLFVTICVMGSALSINTTMNDTINMELPMDAQVMSMGDNALDIHEIYRHDNVNLDEVLRDQVEFTQYMLEDVTMGDVIDITEIPASDSLEDYYYNRSQWMIRQSDYNKVAQIFSLPELQLAQDEFAILANERGAVNYYNAGLKAQKAVTLAGQTMYPKDDHCIEGTVRIEFSRTNIGLMIVPDSFKMEGSRIHQRKLLLGNFTDVHSLEESERLIGGVGTRFFRDAPSDTTAGSISADDDNYEAEIYYYNIETKQDIIDNSVGTSALVTFVGLYLGIIFLISSAAVLALKQLSESSDNRDKYATLRKIGASESSLNHALFWQIFIFFLFPLLIAILHAFFGLQFCNFLLSTLGGVEIKKVLPGILALLAIIYGGYFLITYYCSRNMIREQRK